MPFLNLLARPLLLVPRLVVRSLVRWCLRELRVQCGGMWVVDLNSAGCDAPAEFHKQIERAMQFLREHDPRRAKWIAAHVDYIVNSRMLDSGGRYVRDWKLCQIEYRSIRKYVTGCGELTPRAQEVLTIELAQTIVHEATHARIDQSGIEYNERYRARVEQFCRRQEVQFLKRAAPEFKDLFGVVVDWEAIHKEEWFQQWYETRWQRSWSERFRDYLQIAVREILKRPRLDAPLPTWMQQHRTLWDCAQRFQPWTTSMLHSRAMYLYAAHNFADAAADFGRLAAIEPDDADTRQWLAASLTWTRRYEALQLWQADAQPPSPATAESISDCLTMLGQHEAALEWYERSAGDDADDPNFRAERPWKLIDAGRFEEALQQLEEIYSERDYELGTVEFFDRAVHAWLLHELGRRERFRDELFAARDWWYQCCEPEPVTTRAWVLRASDEISRPGVLSAQAQLLISTEELPPFDWRGYMEQLSEQILASQTKGDGRYQSAYLRSLLYWNDDYPWRQVPGELTGGKRVYVVDMMLDRLFLPGGYLQGKSVTCWLAKTPQGYTAALAGTYDEPTGFISERDNSKAEPPIARSPVLAPADT